MWILSGNLNADHSHRDVWLRPDREVYAGRNSKAGLVVDLVWPTPKNISRPHLVFKAQAVRSDLLELNDQVCFYMVAADAVENASKASLHLNAHAIVDFPSPPASRLQPRHPYTISFSKASEAKTSPSKSHGQTEVNMP